MADSRRPLIELYEARPKLVLVEDASRKGRMIVRGEFGRAGVPTANKRVYTRRLWEREFERLRDAIANRTVAGELNHPTDGRANMFNTSHLLTGLTLTPEGIVVGEAEILEELPGGKVVSTIYRRGGKVGVSSRGFGSTAVDEQGNEVVQEDYQLVTFDFVADPADQFAYPELVTEGSPRAPFYSFPSMTVESTMPQNAQSEAATVEAVRQEMAARMTTAIAEVRATADARALERLAADPSKLPAAVQESLRAFFGAGAEGGTLLKENRVLKVTVAEQKQKLTEANAERDKAILLAKTAGFRYFVERVCGASPDGDAIREAVGDVVQYENAAALKAKVEEIQESIAKQRALDEEARRVVELQTSQLQEEREAVNAEIAQLRTALGKSLRLNRELAVRNYQSEAVTLAPPQSRRVLSAANPLNIEEVDELIESLRPPRLQPDQTESVRGRVRQMMGGRGGSRTRQPTPIDEERSTRPAVGGDYHGLGASLNELQQLSGIAS